MNYQEHDFLIEKIRLFEHGHNHAFVNWNFKAGILVLSSSLSYLKSDAKYNFDEIIQKSDLDQVNEHYNGVNDTPTAIEFGLLDGTKVVCSSRKLGDDIVSLWKVRDVDNPIALLHTIAHDMRSPINSILGMTNLIHQMVKDGELNNAELGKMLEMIKSSCYQATDLTSDILELAKIESKDHQLKTRTVVMEDFLNEYINTHRLLTLKKRILVEFKSRTEAKTKINRSNITRVMDNLMTNAVKFSPAESTIKIDLSENNHFIQVKIKDYGVGMPENMIQQLFVKFGKSQRRGLDGEASHGLGMSIVKQIMDRHEGEVHIESEEGEGTEVTLNFKKI